MRRWRLLDPGPKHAAEQMALDETLLVAKARGLSPTTFRFEEFAAPCTLVGYHQAVEQEIDIAYCQRHGIEINRRITGGGAIWEDQDQVGWEVVASKQDPEIPGDTEELFAKMALGTIRGLRSLGVEASFRPRNDIEVQGRKISGTGGTELGEALLFHGSLLVKIPIEKMLRALRIPVEKLQDKAVQSVRERVTCLEWELPIVPPVPEIKAALRQGFEEVFQVILEPGDLTPAEEEIYAETLPRMQSEEWIYQVRRPLAHREQVEAMAKTPGGLIRATLLVDVPSRRIKRAFITGDFFCEPRRAIYDLEAELKDAPAEETALRRLIEGFFTKYRVKMPGVQPEQILTVISEAINKALSKTVQRPEFREG